MNEQTRMPLRRDLLRAIGCGGVAALGFTRLVAAQSMLPSGREGARRNAWVSAQKAVGDASGMAGRILRSLDTLTSVAATAAATRERLQAELRRLADEIATLNANKARLLEEFRNGLFCSGCNKTKSEILAKGETFPHSGQTVIKPTQAQIDAKERELQSPIDRAERAAAAGKKEFSDAGEKQDVAFGQIRAGVALWRTSVSYWRGSVHKGAREREGELKAGLGEFQRALQAELQRQSRRTDRPSDADVQAEADVWRRLLEKQKQEIDGFSIESQKASMEAFERVKAQRATIAGFMQKTPLPGTLLAVTVVDAPVSAGLSPGELGVNYHLGELSSFARADAAMPPPLPNVAVFVSEFKAAGLPDLSAARQTIGMEAGGVAMPMTGPAPVAASSTAAGNSRLLQALP